MRYDAEHKERTHKRLLKAAAEALRSEGPERIGVAALMARLGLTHGGFYAHFESKDDLVTASIDQMFDESLAGIMKMAAPLAPAEALSRYIDFYLSDRHAGTPGRGCALPALAADVSRLGPAARKRFAAGTERLIQWLATQLRALGHDDAEALQLATSAMAELCGAVAMARAVDSGRQSSEIRARCGAAIKARLGLAASA